jgi:two-component system LytT family response regulator
MNKLTAIIVDDERLARKELASMLREYENIDLIGEADCVDKAAELIDSRNPDVIFLDIQMPGESGFDLINKMDLTAKIIFVTAFDEFAIRAFDINALDYLLKPVNPVRLKQAVAKLFETNKDSPCLINKLKFDDRLFLAVNSKMVFIKINQIIYIKAAGDYTEVVTSGGIKGLTLKTMKEWENRLPDQYFVRIHRSIIINLEKVNRLGEGFTTSVNVYMEGLNVPLVMSRRYAYKLKNKLV